MAFRQLSRKQFLAADLSQRLPTLEGFVALGAVVLLRLTSWHSAFALGFVLWPGMLQGVMPEPWRHARSLRTAGIGHTGPHSVPGVPLETRTQLVHNL